MTFFDFTRNNSGVRGYNNLGAENYELIKLCMCVCVVDNFDK